MKLSGIKRDKAKADELIYIPNKDTQNYFFCWLQFVVEIFGYLTKWINQSKYFEIPKNIKPTNKKTLL